MSIQIITGFSLNNATPIDTRIVASGSSGRDAIPYKYEGLRVFDLSNNGPYVYTGGTWSREVTDQVLGTTGSISKFISSNKVGDSNIYQVGSNIGVNTTDPKEYMQIGSYPVAYSGQSMPLTIHKGGNTIIGYNWYYTTSVQYFDSSAGSSVFVFGSYGDISIQNKAGGPGSLIQSVYIAPSGKVGIGNSFNFSSQPPNSLSVGGTVSATHFSGNGAGVTNITPSNIVNQTLINAGTSLTASNATNVNLSSGSSGVNYLPFTSASTGAGSLKTNSSITYDAANSILNLSKGVKYLGSNQNYTLVSRNDFSISYISGGSHTLDIETITILSGYTTLLVEATFVSRISVSGVGGGGRIYATNKIISMVDVSATGTLTITSTTVTGSAYNVSNSNGSISAGTLVQVSPYNLGFRQTVSGVNSHSLNLQVFYKITSVSL
jgi:hypothetical protein